RSASYTTCRRVGGKGEKWGHVFEYQCQQHFSGRGRTVFGVRVRVQRAISAATGDLSIPTPRPYLAILSRGSLICRLCKLKPWGRSSMARASQFVWNLGTTARRKGLPPRCSFNRVGLVPSPMPSNDT